MSHSGSAEVVGQYSPVLTRVWLPRSLKQAMYQAGDEPLNSRIICIWECWEQLFSCIYLELPLLQLVFIKFCIICFCANTFPELKMAIRSPSSPISSGKNEPAASASLHASYATAPGPPGYTAESLVRATTPNETTVCATHFQYLKVNA